jgi:anti-sigma factor RsiW
LKHLTHNQMQEFGRQKLAAEELLSVSDHLGACEACRRLLERAVQADAAFFAMRSELFGEVTTVAVPPPISSHPTVEKMAGFVDGTLAGEEMQVVTDHLTRCERCALAVEDLLAFRNQAAPAFDREYYPVTVPASSRSWPRRLTPSLLPSFLRSPKLVVAAAMLLLVGSGSLIWLTLQNEEAKPKTVSTALERTGASPPIVAPTPASTPPTAIVELNDGGGHLLLDRNGKLFGADYLPPDYQQLVKEALTDQRLEKSSLLEGLSRPVTSLMGSDREDGEFFVLEPKGKVLITDRPTFRWSSLAGATHYVVEVYDGRFNLVITSAPLIANSWTAPQPLRREVVYSWQVRAVKDGKEFSSPRPPAPQAKFRILDQAKTNELAEAQRMYASSHLTLGLLYTQAGLLDEAERELRALQRANPNSVLVQQLLANVQAMRR